MANTVDLRTPKSEGEWISNKSKATSSYTPNTVQVNSDGSAPSGLSAGTLVNTAGGTYRIDSVNPDGTYNSTHLKDYSPSGGTYGGTSSGGGGTPSSTASGSMRSGSLYTIDDILNNRRANLMGLGIGDMYGITYDQDKLLKVYNQATDAQYALKQKEQQIAENKYYQNLYNTQNSTIDALRAQRNSQIASGMSAGLAAAADSATAMGIQQEGAAGALELANARQTMADEIAAAYAQNIVSALQDSNTLRAQIAGLDLNKYGYDTNFDAAFAGAVPLFNEAYANMYQADLGLQGLREQIASNEAIAAADREAQLQMARYNNYGGGGGYSNPTWTDLFNEMQTALYDAYQNGNVDAYVTARASMTGEDPEVIKAAVASDPNFGWKKNGKTNPFESSSTPGIPYVPRMLYQSNQNNKLRQTLPSDSNASTTHSYTGNSNYQYITDDIYNTPSYKNASKANQKAIKKAAYAYNDIITRYEMAGKSTQGISSLIYISKATGKRATQLNEPVYVGCYLPDGTLKILAG